MSSIAMFLVAAGGVSAIVYWMTTQLGDTGRKQRSAYDGGSGDGGAGTGGNGWNLTSWFAGDSSPSQNCGSSGDFGSSGGDSGGGGDGGGGGGGD